VTRSSQRLPSLAAVVTSAAALALVACGGGGEKPAARGGGGRGAVVFPVEVMKVESRHVEYAITAVGSVEAFEKVQVTARVAGVVEQVRFSEGENVEKDQHLVEIEPNRYQIAVDAARANLQKAEATKAETAASLARREAVVEKNPGLIPGEEIATFRTRVQTGTADVAQARSALDQAQLNLRDAFVSAPVAGRIETRTVQTGQYVQPGAVLATLVQREPLLLRFQVPAPEARSLAAGMPARFVVPGDPKPFTARLTHVAGAAESLSRMVQVTAEVNDPRRLQLRPGAFAEVTVPVGGAGNAPVVPQTAIRASERGFLAFVVQGTTAKERVLQLGLRTAEGSVEVRSGLAHGELLVVRGGEALRDGVTVKPEAPGTLAPAKGPEPSRTGG
jgi:membrane fusion protein, multidrug efflux system